MAHIHEWEENRAKGEREEERVWESGDGGTYVDRVEGEEQRDMWESGDGGGEELLKEKMKEIWERKRNKQRINNIPHAFHTVANLSRYCSMLQKIYHIPHLLNGLKLGLVWDMCQIFSIWHISHICCGCSKMAMSISLVGRLYNHLYFHLSFINQLMKEKPWPEIVFVFSTKLFSHVAQR